MQGSFVFERREQTFRAKNSLTNDADFVLPNARVRATEALRQKWSN